MRHIDKTLDIFEMRNARNLSISKWNSALSFQDRGVSKGREENRSTDLEACAELHRLSRYWPHLSRLGVQGYS